MKKLLYIELDYKNKNFTHRQRVNHILQKLSEKSIEVHQVVDVRENYHNDITYISLLLVENESTKADIKRIIEESDKE